MIATICNRCGLHIDDTNKSELRLESPDHKEGGIIKSNLLWSGHLCETCRVQARIFLEGAEPYKVK